LFLILKVINIESEDTMNYSFQSSSVAKSTSKNQSKSTNIHANRSFNYKLPIKNIKKVINHKIIFMINN